MHACQAGAEMVLSFRTITTCVVYFVDSHCRAQLCQWRKLAKRLWARIMGLRFCNNNNNNKYNRKRNGNLQWSSEEDKVKMISRISSIEREHDAIELQHVEGALEITNHDHGIDDGGHLESNQDYQLMQDL